MLGRGIAAPLPGDVGRTPAARSNLRGKGAVVHDGRNEFAPICCMDRFFRRLPIIAGLVFAISGIMATALALAFPDTPRYIWQTVVWICAVSLGILLVWLGWEITRLIHERRRTLLTHWEFRWPISRKQEASTRPINLSNRVFQFGTRVNFDRLDEFLIIFELRFFNGSDDQIARGARLQGNIHLYNPSAWIRLDYPDFQDNQSRVWNSAFEEFTLTLEQRITIDQAETIRNHLTSGVAVSFIFGSLNLSLDPGGEGKVFRARLWDGVCCTKGTEKLVCERIPDANALLRIG